MVVVGRQQRAATVARQLTAQLASPPTFPPRMPPLIEPSLLWSTRFRGPRLVLLRLQFAASDALLVCALVFAYGCILSLFFLGNECVLAVLGIALERFLPSAALPVFSVLVALCRCVALFVVVAVLDDAALEQMGLDERPGLGIRRGG